jgi:RNA polymerase sigma-70 factor (ECF subfamily)
LSSPHLVEHFFRHEYGRLVAMLSCRVGVHHVEAVEDAVQSALMAALESWPRSGQPDNPSAWLYRVAHNRLLDGFRKHKGQKRILEERAGDPGAGLKATPATTDPAAFFAGEVQDDLLRMLFVCCDDAIPVESQLVFALKTLCGFSVGEISQRLFTSEANIYKRLSRARAKLAEREALPEALSNAQYGARLGAVQKVLYLLFTEGHLSTHPDEALRWDLCNEAIRLTTLLAEHPIGQHPETFALLSLMHLHAARMTARRDASGTLLLLEEQDRTLWDEEHMKSGMAALAHSASGEVFSRYHAEAAIAAEHCLAPSFEETNWQKVAEYYEMLERITPSPLHRLNRAVAVAQWRGPEAGLSVVKGFEPPTWLAGSYLWSAVLADLHRRCGHAEEAQRHAEVALKLAPSSAVRTLLAKRLAQ